MKQSVQGLKKTYYDLMVQLICSHSQTTPISYPSVGVKWGMEEGHRFPESLGVLGLAV
jgi:hypothetical protein